VSGFLDVRELRVGFVGERGRILPVLDSVSLDVGPTEAVGIVGESGSGKSMFCRALIGTLSRHNARILSGSIIFKGKDLASLREAGWRQIRGRQIGYVPQSSLAGLNPVLTIGTQLVEALSASGQARDAARREAAHLLDLVRIPRPEAILRARPNELSGGMRQRVMIAGALASRPALLVADEPTTALDVTVQREILSLLADIRRELGMALILVSHDLAVIEEVCDRLLVMYAGAAVEWGRLADVVGHSLHPYTRALHASRIDAAIPGEDIEAIEGEPPALSRWPSGCRFWPRCPMRIDACRADGQPPLMPFARQASACIRAAELELEDVR
jgi:oligopeptide/dipeptide ABC transporter ATP-binding protein